MNTQILMDIVKYLIVGILVYAVFAYIPTQKMEEKDILLISIITMLLYIGFDSVQKIFVNPSNSSADINSCSKFCSINQQEKMENFSSGLPNGESMRTTELLEENASNISQISNSISTPKIINAVNENNDNIGDKSIVRETTQRDGTVIKYYNDSSYSISPPNDSNISRGLSRSTNGTLNNELKYDKDYPFYDLSTLPLPEGVNPDDLYEQGYSYIPPKDWYPVPPHPPICVTNKRSTVCPNLTTGLGLDLKEWNDSRRVTGPDSINTQYVTDKLNSGR